MPDRVRPLVYSILKIGLENSDYENTVDKFKRLFAGGGSYITIADFNNN